MRATEFLIWCLILTVVSVWIGFASWPAFRLLCEQRFSGVWSSIVIDDCFGSYWSPTVSELSVTKGTGTGSTQASYLGEVRILD